MKDRLWHDVYEMVAALVCGHDVILAPRGDWDELPCPIHHYDALIELKDETVLVLHKGRLPGMGKKVLAGIIESWQCIYANEVFVVFSRLHKRFLDSRHTWRRGWILSLFRYVRSRELKRRCSTIYYVHLPKTGGTSMWSALSQVFPSSVYYADMESFLANPPERGEYDLVGLHFSPSVLAGLLADGDHVVGLLRDPTDRFISGILHTRRPHEDAETFTSSMKAMRRMRIADFLATDAGMFECRLQLIALGTDHRYGFGSYSDSEMLNRALKYLGRDNTFFAPSDNSQRFLELLARRMRFRVPRLRQLNVNDPVSRLQYGEEIQEALPLIERKTAYEQELFAAVCAGFA